MLTFSLGKFHVIIDLVPPFKDFTSLTLPPFFFIIGLAYFNTVSPPKKVYDLCDYEVYPNGVGKQYQKIINFDVYKPIKDDIQFKHLFLGTNEIYYKESELERGLIPEGKKVGDLKQDVWGIEWINAIPYLVKALQELSAKVTALENA